MVACRENVILICFLSHLVQNATMYALPDILAEGDPKELIRFKRVGSDVVHEHISDSEKMNEDVSAPEINGSITDDTINSMSLPSNSLTMSKDKERYSTKKYVIFSAENNDSIVSEGDMDNYSKTNSDSIISKDKEGTSTRNNSHVNEPINVSMTSEDSTHNSDLSFTRSAVSKDVYGNYSYSNSEIESSTNSFIISGDQRDALNIDMSVILEDTKGSSFNINNDSTYSNSRTFQLLTEYPTTFTHINILLRTATVSESIDETFTQISNKADLGITDTNELKSQTYNLKDVDLKKTTLSRDINDNDLLRTEYHPTEKTKKIDYYGDDLFNTTIYGSTNSVLTIENEASGDSIPNKSNPTEPTLKINNYYTDIFLTTQSDIPITNNNTQSKTTENLAAFNTNDPKENVYESIASYPIIANEGTDSIYKNEQDIFPYTTESPIKTTTYEPCIHTYKTTKCHHYSTIKKVDCATKPYNSPRRSSYSQSRQEYYDQYYNYYYRNHAVVSPAPVDDGYYHSDSDTCDKKQYSYYNYFDQYYQTEKPHIVEPWYSCLWPYSLSK